MAQTHDTVSSFINSVMHALNIYVMYQALLHSDAVQCYINEHKGMVNSGMWNVRV